MKGLVAIVLLSLSLLAHASEAKENTDHSGSFLRRSNIERQLQDVGHCAIPQVRLNYVIQLTLFLIIRRLMFSYGQYPINSPLQFDGDWIQGNPQYPLKVGESQGAMIGNELVIVSGFWNSWKGVTKQVYKLDTTDPNAVWDRQDDVLYPVGVSHCAFVVVGQKFYICGGFEGAHPGPHVGTLLCIRLIKSAPPRLPLYLADTLAHNGSLLF